MLRLLGGAIALVVLLTACGEDGDEAERPELREIAVYKAVIADVAEGVAVQPGDDPSDRVVFVDSLDPDAEIDLLVQAEVVVQLEEVAEVIFIDERDEAVEDDGDGDGEVVRRGSALVALGPVTEGDDRVEVDAVRHRAGGDEEELVYVVERVGDDWEVVDRLPAA